MTALEAFKETEALLEKHGPLFMHACRKFGRDREEMAEAARRFGQALVDLDLPPDVIIACLASNLAECMRIIISAIERPPLPEA